MYLFCHEEDEPQIGPLYSHLRYEEGFNVDLSLQNKRLPGEHQRLLQESDGVLLFYGAVEENWVVNKWNLIRRQLANIKGRRPPVRAIFAGQPSTMEKRLLTFNDPVVLKHFDQFQADAIAPFVQMLRTAKGDTQ